MSMSSDDNPSQPSMSRRELLQRGGVGAIAGAMAIESGGLLFSPTEAHAQGLPLKVFTDGQAALFGTLADVLLPGAREAGVVEFVDHQLSKKLPLLIVRY